jgi:DNA-binding CsgD family transcriptional regulator
LTAFLELVVLPPEEVRVTTRSLNILTPRERQVLESLVQGNTTREIADSYGLGRQTVKNYVTVIYDKLGVRGRRQLLQFARTPSEVSPVLINWPEA